MSETPGLSIVLDRAAEVLRERKASVIDLVANVARAIDKKSEEEIWKMAVEKVKAEYSLPDEIVSKMDYMSVMNVVIDKDHAHENVEILKHLAGELSNFDTIEFTRYGNDVVIWGSKAFEVKIDGKESEVSVSMRLTISLAPLEVSDVGTVVSIMYDKNDRKAVKTVMKLDGDATTTETELLVNIAKALSDAKARAKDP